jgi:hypothetical protein
MDTKKFLLGTIAGAVTGFVLGFLIYGNLLQGFFADHGGSATGVMKEMPDFLFLILGELAFGALITYIWMKWANIKTFATGAKGGATIGLLMGLGGNLINYATTNTTDLTGALADVVVSMLMVCIIGGVVGWILGMGDD